MAARVVLATAAAWPDDERHVLDREPTHARRGSRAEAGCERRRHSTRSVVEWARDERAAPRCGGGDFFAGRRERGVGGRDLARRRLRIGEQKLDPIDQDVVAVDRCGCGEPQRAGGGDDLFQRRRGAGLSLIHAVDTVSFDAESPDGHAILIREAARPRRPRGPTEDSKSPPDTARALCRHRCSAGSTAERQRADLLGRDRLGGGNAAAG